MFAAPAVDEPFGLVYLEAMAAGLAPIATDTGGPPSFINVDPGHPTGWLVPPDDRAALTVAMIEAVTCARTCTDRGRRAAAVVRAGYSWDVIVTRFSQLYGDLRDRSAGHFLASAFPW